MEKGLSFVSVQVWGMFAEKKLLANQLCWLLRQNSVRLNCDCIPTQAPTNSLYRRLGFCLKIVIHKTFSALSKGIRKCMQNPPDMDMSAS